MTELSVPVVNTLLASCAVVCDHEQVFSLLSSSTLRLEKIESYGCASPDGVWYDQAETEWVLLLTGRATLVFAAGDALALNAGDYVTLPPHCKHRVEWCSDDACWLALHVM